MCRGGFVVKNRLRQRTIRKRKNGWGDGGGGGLGWGGVKAEKSTNLYSSFLFQVGMGSTPERFPRCLPRDLTNPIVTHKAVSFSRVDLLLASERMFPLAYWQVETSGFPQNTFSKRTVSRGCKMHVVFRSDAFENLKLTCHRVFASDSTKCVQDPSIW